MRCQAGAIVYSYRFSFQSFLLFLYLFTRKLALETSKAVIPSGSVGGCFLFVQNKYYTQVPSFSCVSVFTGALGRSRPFPLAE